MSTNAKRSTSSKWKQVKEELYVSTMLALHDHSTSGVDCEIIIGDADELKNLLPDINLQRGAFTAVGKLKEKTIAEFLKANKEKYRLQVKIFCIR